MNYKQIEQELSTRDLRSELTALHAAVKAEARELLAPRLNQRRAKAQAAALEASQDYYAEEICEAIRHPFTLTPSDVIKYRRRPMVWALSRAMRKNGIKAPE